MIYKIKDLCDINTVTLKNNHNLSYIDYLDTANLNQGSIDTLQRLQFGVDSIPSRAKRVVRDNDILFSTVRPNQLHYGFISNPKKNLICSTGFAVLTPKDNIIPYYLYKYLTQKHIIEYLQGIAETSTSTYPSIKPSDIGELDIDIPSLAEQKAIASILSSLDDKIELNNKINKNLEELAQTLYKRWFVDFEFPNEYGEPYKSSGGEMVESNLGLIPKGWSVLTLDELVVKSSTKTNPDSNEKLIDMANMPSYSIALNSFDNGDKLSTNTYKMKKFSFLYGSIRPYLGKFGIAPFDGITTGTIHNFNVKNNSDYSLVATTVFSTKFNEFCIKLSHGTKMPTIKWDDFVSYTVIYSDEFSYKFNKIVRVIFEQIVNNVLENVKLSKTRDELLPKLMNGEIEVPIEE